MEKQMNHAKKKLTALWIGLAALVLLVGAVIAAVCLMPKAPEAESVTGWDGKLYWNVERDVYKDSKQYSHQETGDGIYRLLFAVDGQQVRLEVRGLDLVRKIDTLEVMGLELDQEGYVIEAYNVEECTGGYAAKRYFVESVDGNTIVANNNFVFRGYSKTLTLTENTQVLYVGENGPLCGMPTTVEYNDEIIAIEDKDGNISHVFTIPYRIPEDVYWNVDKPYDSVNKISTRQPNALMQYELDFILNGEPVTYICKDPEVVNKIDSSRVLGLEFDENGYVIGYRSVKTTTFGGRLGATNYYVEDLDYKDGKLYFRSTSVIKNTTSYGEFFPTEDMVVYDMTGINGPKGQKTQLQLNDRVICLLNNRTMITQIYVVGRELGGDLYWNVDRQWNKTTLSTNRRPDANGWYYFKMAVNGRQITVRTNDLAIANAIEQPVNVGLKLNGDVVEKVYTSSAVYPAGTFASWYKVTDIQPDGTITVAQDKNGSLDVRTGKLAADAKIYNTSSTASMEGEVMSASQIKIGDTIHAYKNFKGEITILYVVSSKSNSPMYWNVEKDIYWDASQKTSKREADEDGYYHILFAVNGKQVTLKTRDKKVVDDIDNRTCMGLSVSGDRIVKVFGATQTVNTQGGLFASSYYVTAINGKTITAKLMTGKQAGSTASSTMTWNCQVYDVSKNADMVGQVATVQVGDQIRGLLNGDKQISVLYILSSNDHETHLCTHCNQEVIWMAWDGTSVLGDGGHYVVNSDLTVSKGIEIPEGADVTLCLGGHTITKQNGRVLGTINGTLNVVDCVGTGHVHGQVNNNASVAMVRGGTLNLYGGTYSAEEVLEAGKNGGLFAILDQGAINMYDGTLNGGKTTGYGGNINISSGIFTLYNGKILDGTSGEGEYGGNIALSADTAVLIVHGGEIAGGVSGSYGGNIAIGAGGARVEITGGTIRDGSAQTHGGNLCAAVGTLTITGGQLTGGTATTYGANMSLVNTTVATIVDAVVTGGQVMARNNGGLTLGGKVNISDLHLHKIKVTLSQDKPLEDAQITVSMTTPGVFAENVTTDVSGAFISADEKYVPTYENETLSLVSINQHVHCDCGGVLDHTCDDTIHWQEWNSDTIMEDGGHYYLAESSTGKVRLEDNATVYLCLNGNTLQYTGRVLADIQAGQTVNICDCGEGGTIHGQVATNNAPVAMVKGTLNIYGGNFTADPITADNKNGGILMAMEEGVINLYDGNIYGGNTTGTGGCVYITNNAALHMFGGTISDGTSATNGGTLTVAGDAVFTMTGGSITGGTAGGDGSCVYFNSTASMTVGGDAVIENLYLATTTPVLLSETVALEPEKASIGMTMVMEGVVVDGVTEEQSDCFANLGEGLLKWQENQLVFVMAHAHCWCVGAENAYEHTCNTAEWIPINTDAANPFVLEDGGYYYLNWKDGNTAKGLKVADYATVYLCLNGSVIRAQTLLQLGEESKIVICDCSEAHNGALMSTKNVPVQIAAGQQVTLMSGTISGTLYYNNQIKKNSVSVTMSGGDFYMYGGTISGGVGTGNGGNITMNGGNFYMYGGTICDGEAAKKGGNVALIGANTRFYMYGGTITNGTAGTFGGNVSLNTGAAFVMDGENAVISNGNCTSTSSTQGGGNVHVYYTSSKFTLLNGTILGGACSTKGGSVFMENGLLEVLGGTIEDGTALGAGSCVYLATNAQITVGGSAQIADVYLQNAKTVSVSEDTPLTGTDVIGITVATAPVSGSSVLVSDSAEGVEAFYSNMEGCSIALEADQIVLIAQ